MGRNSAKRIYKIPGRWQPYTPVGDPIAGTRFISFKVPLKKEYNCNLSEVERFSPKDLIKIVSEKGFQLGLVIDFTYTDRYYDGQEIIDEGVQYEKIKTVGHNIPEKEVMERFTFVVQNFLADNADNEKLIGVHCTHGINRSGYILCRYMIDYLGYEPDAAIEAFNKARGHDLERDNYLCALRGGTVEEIAEVEKQMEEKHLKEMKPNLRAPKNKKTPPPRTDKRTHPFRRGGMQSANEGWSVGGSDRKYAMGTRGLNRGMRGRGFGNRRQPWGHAAYDRHEAWGYQEPGWDDNEEEYGFGNPGPGFGSPGPVYGNSQQSWCSQRSGYGPGMGNQGLGWTNKRYGCYDEQGPGWCNQAPGLGNRQPGFGVPNRNLGNNIGFVDSDQEKIQAAMQVGFKMGVKTALNRRLSRSMEGLPASHGRNVQGGWRRMSGEGQW